MTENMVSIYRTRCKKQTQKNESHVKNGFKILHVRKKWFHKYSRAVKSGFILSKHSDRPTEGFVFPIEKRFLKIFSEESLPINEV